jgi:hypothetical protein
MRVQMWVEIMVLIVKQREKRFISVLWKDFYKRGKLITVSVLQRSCKGKERKQREKVFPFDTVGAVEIFPFLKLKRKGEEIPIRL